MGELSHPDRVPMYARIFLAVLFVALSAFGCDGCGEAVCEPECQAGFACSDGVCLPEDGCPEPCGAGEVCAGSVCIPESGQCTDEGEICQVGLPTSDDYVCLDFDNAGPSPATCTERCDASGMCSSGGLCFFVSTAVDTSCTDDSQCGDQQVCQSGGCRDTICLPSECEGFVEGAQTCNDLYQGNPNFPNGGNCLATGNESYFCVPAGTRRAGESCEAVSSALDRDDFSLTCASGLACVDSVCRDACKSDGDCPGDANCLLEDDDFVDVDTGFCGVTCTPFETGSCGSGQTCFPITEDEGTCIAAGTSEAFEQCQPGAGDCADGTICVTYEEPGVGGTAIARCQPWCDVSVAPAGDDGVVGDFEQAQRDETCPQPETPAARLAVYNLAQVGEPVDIYVGDATDPSIPSLAFAAATTESGDFLAFDAGNYPVTVLPAGAPRTDPPLLETTLNLQSEVSKVFVLRAVPGDSDEVAAFDFAEIRAAADPMLASIRILHGSPDAGPVDVIVVPPGDPLDDPANQTELAAGLDLSDLGPFVSLSPGDYDLLVFPAGSARDDRANAVVTGLGLSVGSATQSTLGIAGTVDENDAADLRYLQLEYVSPPEIGSSGPRFTCVSTGDDILGYCQQECGDDPAVFGTDLCEGEQMGCTPLLLADSNRWRNLCGPVGSGVDGTRCDPSVTWGDCAEGFSCLEYGNAQDGFDPSERGLCRPLCDTTAESVCGAERDCRPLSYASDYAVGECGYACDPGMDYTDGVCPAGLESCKPIASLRDPVTGTIPVVRDEQPFCSASGRIEIGQSCTGADCVAGSECLFPRSTQNTFVATIASPYFGAQGLQPTCTPQCDPFDGDDGPTSCGDGETCLFNFPWSAEVGHCAPIVENVAPEAACTRPGESCGEDSICVVNGGSNLCLRFCDYVGDSGDGTLGQSTCPSGLECTPFVADVGVCLSP